MACVESGMRLEHIGQVDLGDGVDRPVLQDGLGQFVERDDGQRIYGVFVIPDELSGFSESLVRQ